MAMLAHTCRYIFQDLVTAGDLFSYIESKDCRLLESEAAVIARQVAIALCYLHDRNIVHRDLKPDNILMTSLSTGCRVVLTDFGAARRIKSPSTRMKSFAGTDEYAAP
jgi:serine/threonine protein kinase